MNHGLGYLPDRRSAQDLMAAPRLVRGPRSQSADQWLLVRRVRDQGDESSCVGRSTNAALELVREIAGLPRIDLSDHATYYGARARDNYQGEDAGAHIRSAMYYVHRYGVPGEKTWPSRTATINVEPTLEADLDGFVLADGIYARVRGAEEVLDALDTKRVIVFGTQVTDAFMRHRGADTFPAPRATERKLGGHAMVACGHADHGARVRILNSWSDEWGDDGFAWVETELFDLPETQDMWAMLPMAEAA